MHSKTNFDRSKEDVGNVQLLEHVNVTVPDQGLAAMFYVTGLGFTRDPYICLLYTSPSPRDATLSRMPSSA